MPGAGSSAPLLAVDAPSMLFRAFYALPSSIKGADGQPVNALLGAANLILREVEAHEPRAVVLCFGPDAAHYRVELLPEYHADREELPDELGPQWEDSRDFFEAFGWTVASHESLEADDLLGTYAKLETKAGGRALILTGDRDMFQCASDRVTVLYVRTGGRGAEEVDPAGVEERYGIPPELVPDFIALRGDPSDGIPGAKGVGTEDRGRAAAPRRLAGGGARRGDPRDPPQAARRAGRAPRRAARLQADRDPSGRRAAAAEEPPDRLEGRGGRGPPAGDEPAGGAPRGRADRPAAQRQTGSEFRPVALMPGRRGGTIDFLMSPGLIASFAALGAMVIAQLVYALGEYQSRSEHRRDE